MKINSSTQFNNKNERHFLYAILFVPLPFFVVSCKVLFFWKMDRQSLGNKVDICQIGSVGMYYHFYYIAFFLQVYKKNQWEKFFLKCDANVGQYWKQLVRIWYMLCLWSNSPATIHEMCRNWNVVLGIMICNFSIMYLGSCNAEKWENLSLASQM